MASDVTLDPHLISTLAGVAVLTGVALVVTVGAGLPRPWAPLLAVARGAAQLAVISLILGGVIRSPLLVGAALLVMFAVATTTAARRIGQGRGSVPRTAAAMASGVVLALLIVFLSGALAPTPRYLLAIGGIVIGNSMTIATLAGRRFIETSVDSWEEIEGWLALGATPRDATRRIGRVALRSALIPTLDQTSTTGLVTLPGAFVGAIFGGVSPLEAGRFQIVVLATIIAAGSITGLVIIRALAPLRQRPQVPG